MLFLAPLEIEHLRRAAADKVLVATDAAECSRFDAFPHDDPVWFFAARALLRRAAQTPDNGPLLEAYFTAATISAPYDLAGIRLMRSMVRLIDEWTESQAT